MPKTFRDFQDLTPQQRHRLAYRNQRPSAQGRYLAAWLLALHVRPSAANLTACAAHSLPESVQATPGRWPKHPRHYDSARLALPAGNPHGRLQARRIKVLRDYRLYNRDVNINLVPQDVIFAPNPTPEAALPKSDAHIPIHTITRDFALVNEAIPLEDKLILAYRPFRVTQDNIEIYRVAVLGKKKVALGYAGVYHWKPVRGPGSLRTEYAVHLNTLIQKIEAKYRNDIATLLRSA